MPPGKEIKSEADLLNLDYDDVLQLYRGWRKCESALKEKIDELATLRNRNLQLQDSHGKFKGQIDALETVKELSSELHEKYSLLSKEKNNLENEKNQLIEIAEELQIKLEEKTEHEKQLLDYSVELENELKDLKKMYDDMLLSLEHMEKIGNNEKMIRINCETKIKDYEDIIHPLKSEVLLLRQKLDTANQKLQQCDKDLFYASEQLQSLSNEFVNLKSSHQVEVEKSNVLEASNQTLQRDVARLLKILAHKPGAMRFLNTWRNSNDGLTYLGMPKVKVDYDDVNVSHMEATNGSDDYGDDDDDDVEIDYDWIRAELKPSDLMQLKTQYGEKDPFPMTAGFDEELELWVPKEAVRRGMRFLSMQYPYTPAVISDFIRSMNKIWLRREQQRLKEAKLYYDEVVGDLKRQVANARPYRGVIAEKQVRWLKLKVKEERVKRLKGRPRGRLESRGIDLPDFLGNNEHLDEIGTHQMQLMKLLQKLQQDPNFLSNEIITNGNFVSTRKLLLSSLKALEALGRRNRTLKLRSSDAIHKHTYSSMSRNNTNLHTNGSKEGYDHMTDTFYNPSFTKKSFYDDKKWLETGQLDKTALAGKANLTSGTMGSFKSNHPSKDFLKGALWLGRNLTLVVEDLSYRTEKLYDKCRRDVMRIEEDSDELRCRQRLVLLLRSIVSSTVSMTSKCRDRSRNILQGVAAIEPGDDEAMKYFIQNLPTDSILNISSQV